MSDKSIDNTFDEKVVQQNLTVLQMREESLDKDTDVTNVVQAFPCKNKTSRLQSIVIALCLSVLVVIGVLVCIYTYVTQFVVPTIILELPDKASSELAAPQNFTAPETGPKQTVFNLTARSTLEIFPKGIFPDKSHRFFEYLLPDSFLAGGDPRLQRYEAWFNAVNIKSMRFTLTNGNQTITTPTFGLPDDQIGNLTTT